MVTFKITTDRLLEACNIWDYVGLSAGNLDTAIRIAPRFVVDETGEYLCKVILDDEGDIKDFDGIGAALAKCGLVTPRRMQKLAKEMQEAANAIVNPQRGGG